MGYYMRFISTDERKISLTVLEAALKEIDSNYRVKRDETDNSQGDLMLGEDVYGEIEVNLPGDEIFDIEIEELVEFLEEVEGENKSKVVEVLNNASAILSVRVLDQGRASEETFEKIAPIWDCCFKNYSGLVQADDEGYHDDSGLILEVD